VVSAKSTSDAANTHPFPPDPKSSQSTISTVEREIREAGGDATAIVVDVRDVESVGRLVVKTVEVRGQCFAPEPILTLINRYMAASTSSSIIRVQYGGHLLRKRQRSASSSCSGLIPKACMLRFRRCCLI
jgi:hypothetical protein